MIFFWLNENVYCVLFIFCVIDSILFEWVLFLLMVFYLFFKWDLEFFRLLLFFLCLDLLLYVKIGDIIDFMCCLCEIFIFSLLLCFCILLGFLVIIFRFFLKYVKKVEVLVFFFLCKFDLKVILDLFWMLLGIKFFFFFLMFDNFIEFFENYK